MWQITNKNSEIIILHDHFIKHSNGESGYDFWHGFLITMSDVYQRLSFISKLTHTIVIIEHIATLLDWC